MGLQEKYGSELYVIGLHVGGEGYPPKIPAFLERLKTAYPIAYPEDALTAYVFGQESAIPQTAVFDRSGKMVKKIIGFGPDIKTELDQTIAAEIAKK